MLACMPRASVYMYACSMPDASFSFSTPALLSVVADQMRGIRRNGDPRKGLLFVFACIVHKCSAENKGPSLPGLLATTASAPAPAPVGAFAALGAFCACAPLRTLRTLPAFPAGAIATLLAGARLSASASALCRRR